MLVNRSELLQKLTMVSPGLSPRDVIEQSACFVFLEDSVITYNDEVSCRQELPLDVTGVVAAKPLLAILQKLSEDSLEVFAEGGELIVKGRRRTVEIRMDKEVLLPIKNVETPKQWRPLPEDFVDAINLVHPCAGSDESTFWATCVHLHPKWIEACDNFQMGRYSTPTGMKAPVLVKRDAIKHLVSLDMSETSETKSWIHFRNKTGLLFSCRRYLESFPDLSDYLKVKGTATTLPKGLSDAAERAEIFSSENVDANQVFIELLPGKLKIEGIGVSGKYTETKKLAYRGEAMKFLIAPQLLAELSRRYNECEIATERLKVNGGKHIYVACLEKAKPLKKTEAKDA